MSPVDFVDLVDFLDFVDFVGHEYGFLVFLDAVVVADVDADVDAVVDADVDAVVDAANFDNSSSLSFLV